MKIRFNYILFIFITAFLIGCSTVPITNRTQLSLLPQNMLLDMSLTNYNSFLEQNDPLPASNPKVKMTREVGDNIAGAVEEFMRRKGRSNELKNYGWEFNVVQKDQVNAWCMPGGKVVVYTGILPLTEDKSGLAVVMGHEIAHAIANHGNERMSQQLAITLGGLTLRYAMREEPEKTRQIFMTAYGVGSALGTLAYSRKHEYEADKLGMVFMALAGYHPKRAISFWKKMAEKGGPNPPEFISTHPSDENRVEALREYLPKAMKYYKSGNGNEGGNTIQIGQ
ncbi:MAG: M48 family metalloprotease [Bacteroidales bacterium]|nr:M48 family metalloprotease [Bacteroidales bacterium]